MPKQNHMDRFIKYIKNPEGFTRADMLAAVNSSGREYSRQYANAILDRLVKDGLIVKTGYNRYCLPKYITGPERDILSNTIDKLHYALERLDDDTDFSRDDYKKAIEDTDIGLNADNTNNYVQRLLKRGDIVRTARARYSVSKKAGARYLFKESTATKEIVQALNGMSYQAKFSVTELAQFNEFMGRRMTTNVIIVYADPGRTRDVFGILRRKYPGRVLLEPTENDIHIYWTEDMIIVKRLITESPLGDALNRVAPLEKLLVDMVADRSIGALLPDAERPIIYRNATGKYNIDRSRMFRYARRRNAENKLKMIDGGRLCYAV